MRISILILSLSIAVGGHAQTAEELITSMRNTVAKHDAIAYTARLHEKFTNIPDTFAFKEDVVLCRVKDDSVCGGYLRFTTSDTSFWTYDGSGVIEYDTKHTKGTRRQATKAFNPIMYCEYGFLPWWDFFKPDELLKLRDPKNKLHLLKDTVIDGKNCWHVRIDHPDKEDVSEHVSHYYLNKKDHMPILHSSGFKVQGEVQYYDLQLIDYHYPHITAAEFLPKKQMPHGVVTDYVFAKEKEVPLLAKGAHAPQLAGDLLGSAIAPDTMDLAGHVTVLDFFYMSCPPCRSSFPIADSVYTEFASKGVVFIGVDAPDSSASEIERFPEFLKNHPIDYPILMTSATTLQSFSVTGHPTFYFVGKDGNIGDSIDGYYAGMGVQMRTILTALLK